MIAKIPNTASTANSSLTNGFIGVSFLVVESLFLHRDYAVKTVDLESLGRSRGSDHLTECCPRRVFVMDQVLMFHDLLSEKEKEKVFQLFR